MIRGLAQLAVLVAGLAMLASPSQGADGWGIEHEKIVEIEGTVVDVACVLKGDCPANCGGGRRQLGLLDGDGKLRIAVKSTSIFAGATLDLLPHCGKKVLADGLLIENPNMTFVMVQNLRLSKSEPLAPTVAFDKDWAAKNGKATEWFRADPQIKRIIEADGVFGIKGLEPKP
jgi:hypothetical protein